MAQYDGSIRINTKITTKEASAQLMTLENRIVKTADKVASLRSKMDSLKNAKIPTQEYKDIQKQIEDTEKKLTALTERQDKYLATGGKELSSVYKKMNYDAEQLNKTLECAKGEMQELVSAGKAFTLGSGTEEYSKIGQQLKYLEDDYSGLIQRRNEFIKKHNIKVDGYQRLQATLQELGESMLKMIQPVQKIKEAFSASDVDLSGYEKLDSALEELKETASKIPDFIKESFAKLKNAPTESILSMGNKMNSAFLSIAGSAINALNSGIANIVERFSYMAGAISGTLDSVKETIKERLAGISGSMINALLHPIETLKSVASTTINGVSTVIKSGLGPAIDGLKEKMAGLAASAINGIVHPFQTFKKIATSSIKVVSKLLSGMTSGVKKIGSVIKGMTTSMIGFGKSAKKSGGILSTFGSRFKSLALSLLIFNQISKAFNAMISGIKEGFSNLAGENASFQNRVNSLKASLLTLKNALAGAFAPIVQAAIPYIQQLIGWITSAVEAVGQFIAALTGRNTYIKAVQQTAGAFEDAAGAANDAKEAAEGYLSPLDEINKYSDGKDKGAGSGGGGGAGGAGQMFEEVPVDENISNMAEKFKKIMSQLFAPFKEAWNREGKFVMDSWKFALQETWNLMKDIGRDFLTMWNEEATIQMFSDILHIVGDIGLIVGNLAERLREAWNANDVGLHILENIRDIFAIIIGHIRSAADYTVEWAKGLDFYPLLESINGLLEALKPLTDNIGAGLEWFYTNVLLPIAGWTIQEAIPAFLDMLAAAIYAVNQVIEVLKPLGTWLWENFLQPLGKWAGETIISAMTKVTELLKKLGDWISKHSEAIQKFITIVAPIAGIVLLIANAGTILTVATTALGIAFGLLTSPITLIIAAIAALAAGFVYLYENVGGFRNFIDGIIEGAKQLIPGIIQGIKDGWNSFIKWLGDLWDEIVESFKDFFGIHSPSTVMAEMGKYLIQGLLDGIKGLAGNVKQAWDSMKQTAVDTWETVKQNIGEKWEQIKSNSSTTFSNIAGNIKTVWTNIGTNIKTSVDNAKNNISTAWSTAKENTRTAWDNMKTKASTAVRNIASNVMEKYENIKNAINSFASSSPDLWENAWNGMQSALNGVLGNMKSAVSSVFNWISERISSLGNALRNLTSRASSSKSSSSSSRYSSSRMMRSASPYALYPEIAAVDTSNIPGYATGQVIPTTMKRHLAILGDNSKETEVVSPLSTIRQALREEAMSLGLSGAGSNGNLTLKVYLEDSQLINPKKIFEAVITEGKVQQMSTGKNRLLLEN